MTGPGTRDREQAPHRAPFLLQEEMGAVRLLEEGAGGRVGAPALFLFNRSRGANEFAADQGEVNLR